MIKHFTSTREVVYHLIPAHAHGRVLDVGAGTAKYRAAITPHVERYQTSDIFAAPHIDFVESAMALTHQDCSFDTILSFQTLEHVDDPAKAVREMYRVLKPEGTVIVTTPFLIAEHKFPTDYQRFTRDGLRLLFERAGFTVTECEGYGSMFGVLTEGVKFYFLHPKKDKHYGPIRRRLVMALMRILMACERHGFSNNQDFYANVYLVASKPA